MIVMGLLRRFAPRNDIIVASFLAMTLTLHRNQTEHCSQAMLCFLFEKFGKIMVAHIQFASATL